MANFKHVTVGDSHTCALQKNGEVYCFGYNAYGQLGNGSYQNSLVLTKAINLKNVEKLVSNDTSTCALISNGNVRCFGYNSTNNLGDSLTQKSNIATITSLPKDKVVNIFSGLHHYCALTQDDELWCFGRNSNGQLGLPSNISRSNPFKIDHPVPIKQAYLGPYATCFKDFNEEIYCSGYNDQNLFSESSELNIYGFEKSYEANKVSYLSLTNHHSCAIHNSSLLCNEANGVDGSTLFHKIEKFKKLNKSLPIAHRNSNRYEAKGLISLSAALSFELDDSLSYSWSLNSPASSNASLISSESKFSSFYADVTGTYTVFITVSKGNQSNSTSYPVFISDEESV
ncbi:hypothetical protein MJH12_05510, partial [bacterium]|nr:hypothetical protein [bacterium]